MIADLGLALVAGLLSCASPCVLPLLPGFVAYLGGMASGAAPGARDRWTPVAGAGLFVAGFSTAFVALGAGAGLAGASLGVYRPALLAASGAVLVALGLALLAGPAWLLRERRLHLAHRLPRSPLTAYVVGITFAVGWTPCVGPVLAAILVEAADTATAPRGAALLASYSAGLGLPFMVTAVCVAPLTRLLRRVRGGARTIEIAAAALLVAMGLLTLTDQTTVLNGLVPNLAGRSVAKLEAREPAVPARPADGSAGRPAPAVTVTGVDGRRLSLSELRGRPVVVTFWATWCVACEEELPLLDATAQADRGRGLAVVAIDYRESASAVSGFWRARGLHLVPYLDPDGAAARSFGVGLQQTGLPVTVLVDRHASVRSVILGQLAPQVLEPRLDEIL